MIKLIIEKRVYNGEKHVLRTHSYLVIFAEKSLAAHSSPAQQMLNPFGGMPGLPIAPGSDLNSAAAAGLLPFLYPGLGNMYPGMPMMPGMIPGESQYL